MDTAMIAPMYKWVGFGSLDASKGFGGLLRQARSYRVGKDPVNK